MRCGRPIVLCAAIAAVALAGCGDRAGRPSNGDSTAARAADSPIEVGLAANVDGGGDIGVEMDLVAGAGAGWLREDLEWSEVERRRGKRDWRVFDRIVAAAARREVRVLPILDSSPCWAVGPDIAQDQCWRHLPDTAAFARFAAAAARRYGRGGAFWRARPELDPALAIDWFEVWNEPYYPGGTEPIDPARFAALFRAAVEAGRAAASRSRWLLPGALTVNDGTGERSWAQELQRADPRLASLADGLSVHLYPADDGAALSGEGATAVSDAFEEQFERSLPVWVTELGFAACGPEAAGVGNCAAGSDRASRERRKADLIETAMRDLAAEPRVHAVFIYTLREFDRPFYGDAGLLDVKGDMLPAWRNFNRISGDIASRDAMEAPEKHRGG